MEWTLFSFEILSRAAMDRNDLKKKCCFYWNHWYPNYDKRCLRSSKNLQIFLPCDLRCAHLEQKRSFFKEFALERDDFSTFCLLILYIHSFIVFVTKNRKIMTPHHEMNFNTLVLRDLKATNVLTCYTSR